MTTSYETITHLVGGCPDADVIRVERDSRVEMHEAVTDRDDANCARCLGRPVALLIDNGVTEDGRRILIHVWPDGTGELAYAPQGTTAWGAPFPLIPAP